MKFFFMNDYMYIRYIGMFRTGCQGGDEGGG